MGPSPAPKYDVNKWYKFSFVMQMLKVLITVMPSSADLKSGDCLFYRTSTPSPTLQRRQMSAHALLKMTRDLFRAMSLALRQKYPRKVVEMKDAMAAFFGSDSVVISCHCKRSKIIFIKVLTEVCSLENIASWNWRKIAVSWSDSVLLTLR